MDVSERQDTVILRMRCIVVTSSKVHLCIAFQRYKCRWFKSCLYMQRKDDFTPILYIGTGIRLERPSKRQIEIISESNIPYYVEDDMNSNRKKVSSNSRFKKNDVQQFNHQVSAMLHSICARNRAKSQVSMRCIKHSMPRHISNSTIFVCARLGEL